MQFNIKLELAHKFAVSMTSLSYIPIAMPITMPTIFNLTLDFALTLAALLRSDPYQIKLV